MRVVALALVACSAAGCRFSVGGSADLATSAGVDLSTDPTDLSVVGSDLTSGPDLAAPDLLVAGILSATRIDTPPTTSLSTEGLADWTHYGLAAAGDVNRKSGVTASIKMSAVGLVRQYGFYPPSFSWTGGTPTASATTTSGVYLMGAGSAFTLTVPADATTRTLSLYISQGFSTGTLLAHLSDGSAADFSMATMATSNLYHRYTISFRASRPGQTLTVSWTLTVDAGGDIDLMAATYY